MEKIISTGSHGNFIKMTKKVAIDMGVRYDISDILGITDIFITHEHRDHMNVAGLIRIKSTTRIRIWTSSAGVFLKLKKYGVACLFLEPGKTAVIGDMVFKTFKLHHDVANYGIEYLYLSDTRRGIYATDFGKISDLPTGKYDEIMIEGNYDCNSDRDWRVIEYHNSIQDAHDYIVLNGNKNVESHILHQSSRL